MDDTLPQLGYRLATFQRYDDGIALLEEYLALDPDDPTVIRAAIAEMRAERGETERALRELNALIESEPDSFIAITTLVLCHTDIAMFGNLSILGAINRKPGGLNAKKVHCQTQA